MGDTCVQCDLITNNNERKPFHILHVSVTTSTVALAVQIVASLTRRNEKVKC